MSNDDWPVAFYRGEDMQLADIALEQEKYTALFTAEAVEVIEQSGEQPFFIYLSHKDPHQPFFPSQKFAGKSKAGPYGDAVAEFDWSVGEVLAALERRGIAEQTLVLVTSDNGPWYEGSSGGMRGRKGQSYEGGFRVPLLAWWPGQIAAGSVEHSPVMNIDFFPTVSHLAGIDLPRDRLIDGVDLTALLTAQPQSSALLKESLDQRALFFFHDYDVEAVRVGEWKYVSSISHYVWPNPLDKQDSFGGRATSARDYSPPGSDISVPTLGRWPLLYHLGRDPAESYNVADTYPATASEMKQLLDDWKEGFYEDPRKIEQHR